MNLVNIKLISEINVETRIAVMNCCEEIMMNAENIIPNVVISVNTV